ncbi:glycosyltransferase [Cytophagaceae bacterium ABcell3]|nr:glycosyltransferase [Cytophagaceae bacterium ABcell3]
MIYIILAAPLLIYFLFVLYLYYSWLSIKVYAYDKESGRPCPFISVIVPIRNEADNLPLLIKSLHAQQYDNFELILVDDHSTDGSVDLAKSLLVDEHRFKYKIISMEGSGCEGKKKALLEGVENASGEIVLCTDGDCQAGPHWVASVGHYFAENDCVMLSGGVAFINDGTLFNKLQDLEFTSLIGTGAACMKAGFPNMCNGANLAYRREVFFEVNGFSGNEDVASGDDEFLMHKVWQKYPGKVHFLKSTDNVIYTRPCPNLTSFFFQRRRWSSKWDKYTLNSVKYIAFFVFLTNVSFLVLFWMTFVYKLSLLVLLTLFTVKLLLDFMFVRKVTNDQGRHAGFLPFLLLQLIHPYYILIFGVLSKVGNYKWKGRTYK